MQQEPNTEKVKRQRVPRKKKIRLITNKPKTVMLRAIPKDCDRLIEREQSRLDLYEEKRFKKEAVVYRMLREWYRLKNIESELMNKISQTNATT